MTVALLAGATLLANAIEAPEVKGGEVAEICDANGRTYFYLVEAAFSSLREARDYVDNLPGMQWAEVFKCNVKGKVVYRCGTGPYNSRSDAEQSLRHKRDFFGPDKTWICPSTVKFPVVYSPDNGV